MVKKIFFLVMVLYRVYNCPMLKRTLELILVLFLVLLTIPREAQAYLDPGSGSYLIQIIIASVAGVGYFLKLNWEKVKNVFLKKGKKEIKDEEGK
jgi:hypothetical protein